MGCVLPVSGIYECQTEAPRPERDAEVSGIPISPLEGEMAGRPEGGNPPSNLSAPHFFPICATVAISTSASGFTNPHCTQ